MEKKYTLTIKGEEKAIPDAVEDMKEKADGITAIEFYEVDEKEMIINMSHICELAHELTRVECDKLGIICDEVDDDGNTKYSSDAQPVFDKYYDLITNTLNF